MFNFLKNNKKSVKQKNQDEAHKYDNKAIKVQVKNVCRELSEFEKQFYIDTKYDVSLLENLLLTNIDEKLLSSYMEEITKKSNPDDLKMICIEYLRMSFFGVNGIPHLLLSVIK